MDSYSILDGVGFSLFAILIVFLILILLALIISLLRYLPDSKADSQKDKTRPKRAPAAAAAAGGQVIPASLGDEEERMVAMLVASCVAQESLDSNVEIISIERAK